ncbi:zinc finger ZZ-type and EF-hand domain-containing protein 1-like isoform X1 [Mya arenaria]|uniref:zinc finger ZZ-type and EF-hand domain-containing protein 1-like isoform X1 n=1 Tax=Mya arenaria TaxID=6604 RepID=UPI0022E3517E|nr:zinc finger ZZ-type and EF-hand domain-containing protein 1-like isoform X1 [Mya arenaria]
MGSSHGSCSEMEDDEQFQTIGVKPTMLMDECASDNEDVNDKESPALTELLDSLFKHEELRNVASKIKEEIPENIIQQNRHAIVRWLEDKESKGEETVSMAQFVDFLTQKTSVSKDDAIRGFQQFDTDGSGVVEIGTTLSAMRYANGPNMVGELGKSIKMLQACTLTPGFVDVYSEDKNAVSQHADRLLKYLVRNRAPSHSLPFPYLNGFNNTASMRLTVLKNTFAQMKEAAKGDVLDSTLSDGEEVKLLNPCYSKLEVSSNPSDAYKLTNGLPHTFWQSDGAARSHWIRLYMKPHVVVKTLSIHVVSSDSSYMPEYVTVTAASSIRNMREIKEVRIPSDVSGEVVLLKGIKRHYQIIQINIRKCRNDGCDTRVHGIKAVGFKVVKEAGISVSDSAAVWFMQVLASTITAAIPMAPILQKNILEHSRVALEHIPPLSLSPASTEKPQFLSKLVLQEVEKFITNVAVHDSEMLKDGVQLLLAFNLARGNIAGLLRTLKILQDNPDLSLPCTKLLLRIHKARDMVWEKSGHQLSMTLQGCDGGSTDENNKPELVLTSNWNDASPEYTSAEGKMKVNMVFKAAEMVQVTRVKLRVSTGNKGAKRGLVFVYRDSEEFKLERHLERFEGYDSWGKMEYQFCVQVRNAGIAGKPDNPVGYFCIDDDIDEIDIPVSWHPIGNYVLVKFLEPRQQSASKIGIAGLRLYGFTRKPVMVDDAVMQVKHPPNPEKHPNVSSVEVIQHVASFLIDICQDLAHRKKISTKPDFLEFSDIPLDILCELYHRFREGEDEAWQAGGEVILQLLFSLLPALTNLSGESKASAEQLFQHLCKTVDSQMVNRDGLIYRLSKQLIIDGAAVFFSDKEARKRQLFSLMHKVETLSEMPSVMLVFQSLCQFFSSVDPRGLLDLPKNPTESFDPTPVLEVMETMVMVTFHEFSLVVATTTSNKQLLPLLNLVSSLQTSMLSWCSVQVTDGSDKVKVKAMHTASSYAILVMKKATESVRLLRNMDMDKLKELLPSLETSFLGAIVRQLVLMLTYLCASLNSAVRISLVKHLAPFNQELWALASLLPDTFPTISSTHWQGLQSEDIVLRTWEVESGHNYENNVHYTQSFYCPGASKYIVEFDPRCETERRYDYLVFTDTKGQQMRFDQKVGSPKWPRIINFQGPHIHFLFHSDSSNTEWGYKFKVTARGSQDLPLSWPYDLQLGLIKLMGKLCGATLNANPTVTGSQLLELEEVAEQDILRSELWATLFRGGYMIGKLQRSLSGRYVPAIFRLASEDSTEVLEFLLTAVNGDEKTQNLIKRCAESCKVLPIGGENVRTAVIAVFAALVWHTQQLRDDLEKYVFGGMEGTVSDGLCQAYQVAETQRALLVQQKQKLMAETDSGEVSQENDPAVICKQKALFLLKFAGLTKTQLKHELSKSRLSKQMKKLARMSSRQANKPTKYDMSDKYPSFRLVLEFLQDHAWSTDKVQSMLQERSSYAQAVSDVYQLATELIKMLSKNNPFQILIVLFLQEMLSQQEGFARHYAEGLDGCGLELEARVRLQFYSLIRKLTEAFHTVKRHELDSKLHSAYDYVQAALLHLLDIQWQPYDLTFISEVRLPELFSAVAKETVKMRDWRLEALDEATELKDYNTHIKWFEECSEGSFITWYKNKEDLPDDQKKDVQMFIARFCDLLEVEVNCDGCNVTLPGRRYRCLQCVDMDLCATCYAGGVEPEKHSDDHDIIHLVFKCNKCQAFIVGTRIHCNECEDFDLCLGCHQKGNLPTGHNPQHSITKFHQRKLKTSQDTDSLIQAYIHQHVWMLFTLLSISMGDLLSETSPAADTDYTGLATHLQNQCIAITTHCLQQVPEEEEEHLKEQEVAKLAEKTDASPEVKEGGRVIEERSIIKRQEEAFSIHSQERIMGLLGAMIPHDTNAAPGGSSFNFMTPDFLKLLFKISKGESGHEVNTRHLALGLLGLLLTKCPVKVADESVSDDMSTGGDPGSWTIKYLFSFGAICLEKSGLEWSCSVARILQRLYTSPDWRPVLHTHLTGCVQDIAIRPELSSIFAMFVMAGFPEVLTTGTLVNYNQTGMDVKTGVVLKHFPDKHSTLLVDVKSRKRHTVLDKYVDCVCAVTEVVDPTNIAVFVDIVKNIVDKKTQDAGENVESLWVLSLALKLLHNSMQGADNCAIEELYAPEFIQCLVSLASKGTGFSQQWLLKDIEILSLMLYTHEGCSTSVKKTSACPELANKLKELLQSKEEDKKKDENICSGGDDDDDDDDDDNDDDSDIASSSSSMSSCETEVNMVDELDMFHELDEKTQLLFRVLRSDLNLPISVLKVIYDMNDRNPDSVVKAILENFEGIDATPKEIIKKLSDKWDAMAANPEAQVAALSDKVIDTGIHFHPSLTNADRHIEKATEETAVDTQRLIHCPDNDVQDEVMKQRRTKSADLLKKELEKHGRTGSREYLVKVNQAMSILYARQVLTSLLAQWPVYGHVISSELLGCKDVTQIPCVLDLLNKTGSKDNFQKVVKNLVEHCDPASLVPIACTACQFMEEVTMSVVTRESAHNYKNEDLPIEKIQLPGASFLTVTFDPKCATCSRMEEDELVFGTSADLQQNEHRFSGTARGSWSSFQVPGDTIYCKFICDNETTETLWGYKFTITAGTRDSFETGYIILNSVLSSNLASCLPLSELWGSLVYVCSKQTGTQRLKIIQLLLKILQTQHRVGGQESLGIDLSVLRPLWQLYTSVARQDGDSTSILPPVPRALTELFLQVENLAIEWNIVDDFLVMMQDMGEIRNVIEQGIKQIAAVSVMIGYKNLATKCLKRKSQEQTTQAKAK